MKADSVIWLRAEPALRDLLAQLNETTGELVEKLDDLRAMLAALDVKRTDFDA